MDPGGGATGLTIVSGRMSALKKKQTWVMAEIKVDNVGRCSSIFILT
jgi:hypothetical protein